MTLGEKIKKARKEKKISQAELTKNIITRNMLSRIENNTATPSLDTLRQLAEALTLPLPYLLSEEDDLFFFEKKEIIDAVYKAYAAKDYAYCINKIKKLGQTDGELAYIVATSALELTRESIRRGSLISALNYVKMAEEYSEKTVYDTTHITAVLPMYSAIAKNIQSPLLEFTPELYQSALMHTLDYETFQYLIQNHAYEYKSAHIRDHIKAKELIKERNYPSAVKLLLKAAEENSNEHYNAFIQFGIYSDLEICYKQLYDFENAYKYSAKRMSMLEGFKS